MTTTTQPHHGNDAGGIRVPPSTWLGWILVQRRRLAARPRFPRLWCQLVRDGYGNLFAEWDDDAMAFYTMRYGPIDQPEGFPYREWRVLLDAAEVTVRR